MANRIYGVIAASLIVAVCLAGEPALAPAGKKSDAGSKSGTSSVSAARHKKPAGLSGKDAPGARTNQKVSLKESATPASGTDQPVRWVNGKPLPWPWDDMPYRIMRPGDGC